MSDIAFYGLGSALAVMFFGALFLLGLLVTSIAAWLRRKKQGEAITKTPYFPHILGLGLSLCGVGLAALFLQKGYLFFKDAEGYHDYLLVPKWMDNHVWLWGTGLFLLWPLGALLVRRHQRKIAIREP